MENLKTYLRLYYIEMRTWKPAIVYWIGLLFLTGIYVTACAGWWVTDSMIFVFYYIMFLFPKELMAAKFQKIHYIAPLGVKTIQGYMKWRILIHELYFLVLTMVSYFVSMVLRTEFSVWRALICFFTFSLFGTCGTLEGIYQLVGKKAGAWLMREKLEMIWIILAFICIINQWIWEIEGIAGSISLLLGFSGWITLHVFVWHQCGRIVTWQDYKEPRPFLSAKGKS